MQEQLRSWIICAAVITYFAVLTWEVYDRAALRRRQVEELNRLGSLSLE